MAKINAEARQYVLSEYVPGVAEYLLNGDGFKATDGSNLANMWRSFFEELAGLGYMRRSRTGRYWWADGSGGQEHDRDCAGCGNEAAGNVEWFPGWRCRSCQVTEIPDEQMITSLADHTASAIEKILGA